jgi:hypothetical protein
MYLLCIFYVSSIRALHDNNSKKKDCVTLFTASPTVSANPSLARSVSHEPSDAPTTLAVPSRAPSKQLPRQNSSLETTEYEAAVSIRTTNYQALSIGSAFPS